MAFVYIKNGGPLEDERNSDEVKAEVLKAEERYYRDETMDDFVKLRLSRYLNPEQGEESAKVWDDVYWRAREIVGVGPSGKES